MQDEDRWPGNDRPRPNGRDAAPPLVSDAVNDWDAARTLYETDEPVDLEVTGYNRGGLIVGLNSLRGFVPASHLVDFPSQISEDERKFALAQKIGQRLHLKVIEYDQGKGRVVFSERAAQARPGSRKHVLETLSPGDVVTGIVTNVCDFGAFVDLGGLEGLIHVSEVSWNRVAHPRDVLCCNQDVQVSVISVDRAQARVALSLKRLRPDPWGTVADRYRVGEIIEGTVTNVVNFGAFVCLADGLEGLIHISELAEGNFLNPRNIVREGERVRVRVMSIDGHARRLGLSLRRVAADYVAS
jgi:small subunit ribosomal protein S1